MVSLNVSAMLNTFSIRMIALDPVTRFAQVGPCDIGLCRQVPEVALIEYYIRYNNTISAPHSPSSTACMAGVPRGNSSMAVSVSTICHHLHSLTVADGGLSLSWRPQTQPQRPGLYTREQPGGPASPGESHISGPRNPRLNLQKKKKKN